MALNEESKAGALGLVDERGQRILQWKAQAWEVLSQIEGLNVEPAAEVVRQLNPSPEVIACLAFFYDKWKRSAMSRRAAQHERKEKTLDDLIAETGCKTYAELRAYEYANVAPGERLPPSCITERYRKGSINNAFTRLKKAASP